LNGGRPVASAVASSKFSNAATWNRNRELEPDVGSDNSVMKVTIEYCTL
jgi:hypothetical protein